MVLHGGMIEKDAHVRNAIPHRRICILARAGVERVAFGLESRRACRFGGLALCIHTHIQREKAPE